MEPFQGSLTGECVWEVYGALEWCKNTLERI